MISPLPTVACYLSRNELEILKPALLFIAQSYGNYRKNGSSKFSYPFQTLPPPPEFGRGVFNAEIMQKILRLSERITAVSNSRVRVEVDAIEVRAAVFALRSQLEFNRSLRRQERTFHKVKPKFRSFDKRVPEIRSKTRSVIHSLERIMKRANRAFIRAAGTNNYAATMSAWKAHLRWMRLRIAFHKPWGQPIYGRRKRQQAELDDLMEMARKGIRNAGYQPPDDKNLRHVIRLYARYARKGRQGNWTTFFLLQNKKSFSNTYHLAHFVLDRIKLRRLPRA